MVKDSRRYFALILVLVLGIGMMPTQSFADNTDELSVVKSDQRSTTEISDVQNPLTDLKNNISNSMAESETSSNIIRTPDGYSFDTTTAAITGYSGNSGDIEIPGQISGITVTRIGDGAFNNCSNLTSITIPNGVTSIGYSAFSYCCSINCYCGIRYSNWFR